MYGTFLVTWYNPCTLIGYGPYERALLLKKSTNLHTKKHCLAHEVKARRDYKALTRLWLASVCHFHFQMNLRYKHMSVTFVNMTFRWQKVQYRSRKDSQQKRSLVVRQAITAKDSRQKPQGFAAKAIVGCS